MSVIAATTDQVRILRVSSELLVHLLHLPPDTRIVGVSGDVFFDTGDVAFKVASPAFTPVRPNHAIPVVNPQFTDGPVFQGWGDAK